jgi:hypothetical protein
MNYLSASGGVAGLKERSDLQKHDARVVWIWCALGLALPALNFSEETARDGRVRPWLLRRRLSSIFSRAFQQQVLPVLE